MRNTPDTEYASRSRLIEKSSQYPSRNLISRPSFKPAAFCGAIGVLVLVMGCQTFRTPWGTVQDPSGKCAITWTNRSFAFALPGGIFDLSPYQTQDNLAPRVLRPVSGDFTATVRVIGDFDPGVDPVIRGRAAFFGAGLLVWESRTNYVRLERNEWTFGPSRRQRHGPLFEHWFNQRNQIQNVTLNEPFFQGDSTWLRLSRLGDQMTAEYSHDGKEWSTYKTVTAPMGQDVQVGVAAISTSKKPFEVQFAEFQLE